MYNECAELAEAAQDKTQQIYTDSLQTLSDAESVQLVTVNNMSVISDAAGDIRHQVSDMQVTGQVSGYRYACSIDVARSWQRYCRRHHHGIMAS